MYQLKQAIDALPALYCEIEDNLASSQVPA
jgi:hypothetical protein